MPLLGLQAGEASYREGLDFDADGIIDFFDLRAMIPSFGQPADTGPTRFCGFVTDALGNALAGVTVKLSETDSLGYALPLGEEAMTVTNARIVGSQRALWGQVLNLELAPHETTR